MEFNESWIQVISLFMANSGLIIWFRAESRSDWRHMDNKIDANQKETAEIMRAIQEEVKDFHARLCIIEEKNKGRAIK